MGTASAAGSAVTCAAEVFIATVLLHRENPERKDFTIQEIVNRAARENVAGELRSGVSVHASQHCCANRAPNPANHRMLYATGRSTRRLLCPGDVADHGRTGKIFPDSSELPERYLPLLQWAKARFEKDDSETLSLRRAEALQNPEVTGTESRRRDLQALLDMRLAGAHLANGEDADDYVRRLREGWD